MTVVADPPSRLTLVTVVSVLPGVGVVEVAVEAAPLSGSTMVVFGGGKV